MPSDDEVKIDPLRYCPECRRKSYARVGKYLICLEADCSHTDYDPDSTRVYPEKVE